MKILLKVLGVAVLTAALFMLTFVLWGGRLETLFSAEACAAWFEEIRSVAWAAAIGLLVVDLLLPIPATGVMAALGSVYGVALGAAVGTVGSAAAGLLGYGLARLGGRGAAGWIADEQEQARFRAFFDRWGGFAVIASRILPILPEVVAVLAGLAGMRLRRFTAALLLGTAPTALLFAWLGHASRNRPWWGMVVAILVPLVIWPIFLRATGLKATVRRSPPPAPPGS